MKKILIVLLTIVMTLSYSACTKEPTEYGAFIGDPYGEVVELDLDQLTFDPDWRITEEEKNYVTKTHIMSVHQCVSNQNYLIKLKYGFGEYREVILSDWSVCKIYECAFNFVFGVSIEDFMILNMQLLSGDGGFSIDFDLKKTYDLIINEDLKMLSAEQILQQTPLYGDVGKEIESAQAFIDAAKVATTAAFQIWSNVPVE